MDNYQSDQELEGMNTSKKKKACAFDEVPGSASLSLMNCNVSIIFLCPEKNTTSVSS